MSALTVGFVCALALLACFKIMARGPIKRTFRAYPDGGALEIHSDTIYALNLDGIAIPNMKFSRWTLGGQQIAHDDGPEFGYRLELKGEARERSWQPEFLEP